MTMTKRETILQAIADAAATDVALQYHPNEVGFDPVKRADALAERAAYAENESGNLRFILSNIIDALDIDPDEGIVPAIKGLQERAERIERDVESLCSAARKFCAWVAAECLEDVFPLNLFECQQAIYDAFARRDARIAELESNISLPLENARETISTAAVKESLTTQTDACEMLRRAACHMLDRAATYDAPGGERSMSGAIKAFNAITAYQLSESDGWLLMQLLKDARQWQRTDYHADSAEDCIAYAALKAEALAREAA